jgi:hypothetical protein
MLCFCAFMPPASARRVKGETVGNRRVFFWRARFGFPRASDASHAERSAEPLTGAEHRSISMVFRSRSPFTADRVYPVRRLGAGALWG